MVTFLYSLSDLAIAVLFSLTIALVFMAAPLLRHKLFGEISDPVSDFVRATMTPSPASLGWCWPSRWFCQLWRLTGSMSLQR